MRGWLPVILITAILVLGGCGEAHLNDDIQTTSELDKNQLTSPISKETSNDINYITDWSLDELVQNIELNGKSYSMPFTVEDLGEGYSLGEKNDNGYDLYYNGNYYALIRVAHYYWEIEKCDIICITFFDDPDLSDTTPQFKLGEFCMGSERDNIISLYGDPTEFSEGSDRYIFSDGREISVTYKDEKLAGLFIDNYLDNLQ